MRFDIFRKKNNITPKSSYIGLSSSTEFRLNLTIIHHLVGINIKSNVQASANACQRI
jgi:hypothetical protein